MNVIKVLGSLKNNQGAGKPARGILVSAPSPQPGAYHRVNTLIMILMAMVMIMKIMMMTVMMMKMI